MPTWALAFATATGLTLAGVPLARRLALATDFVDHPGRHKTHLTPTPYLGGVALICGVLVALLFEVRLGAGAAAVALVAALLGAIGLLDDDRTVDPRWRFLAEVAAATVGVAIGLRVHVTGVVPIDIALTLVWTVGVTNSLNLLDNMDGLAAGVGMVAAWAVFVLAIFGRQPAPAALAAALAGACLAFGAYNRPPASIFMGDAGSLFVGFVLAVLTIDVSPALTPPFSFAIPLMLLALPVLDTATVTLSRLRRGRPVSLGGSDHLSHRLVARGLSRGRAVALLVAAEALLGVLAVLGGRRVLPLGWTLAAALLVLGAVAAAALPARVYSEDVVGLPRPVRLALAAVVVVPVVLAAPALGALGAASSPARAATTLTEHALDAMAAGDGRGAAAMFERAGRLFQTADDRLHRPLSSAGVVVPGLSANLAASRTLVSIGRQLAQTGGALATAADANGLELRGGSVSLDAVRRLAPALAEASTVLERSRQRLAGIEPAFLVPPLTRATDALEQRLRRQAASVGRSADLARLLPEMLGQDKPRRYFLAFQDNLEAPGTGGAISGWAELVATAGEVRLERFGKVDDLDAAAAGAQRPELQELPPGAPSVRAGRSWRGVNVTPDFPTAARLIAELYPRSGGRPLDGGIAVDRAGLAALLGLTGPVRLEGSAAPVSAADVVSPGASAPGAGGAGLAHQLLSGIAEHFLAADLGTPARLARALGDAGRNGHVLVNLSAPGEQSLVERWGADGAVPPVQGDSLLVVDEDLGPASPSSAAPRRVRYDVRLKPGGRFTTLTGSLEVRLPPSPAHDRRLSVYTPFGPGTATSGGEPAELVSQAALGRQVHSVVLRSPTLRMELVGRIQLSLDGWYRLDFLHQPTLVPDQVELHIDVPRGWKIAETRGVRWSGTLSGGTLRLSRDQTVWARLERTGWGRVLDRLASA